MKRSIAGLVVAAALPAAAQWKVPDNLPPLPDGGASCNDTHCLVNRSDLLGLDLLARIAGERLAEKDRELAAREAEIAELQRRIAKMRPQCATVEKVPVPGERQL